MQQYDSIKGLKDIKLAREEEKAANQNAAFQ
jgi:hypothetical protein